MQLDGHWDVFAMETSDGLRRMTSWRSFERAAPVTTVVNNRRTCGRRTTKKRALVDDLDVCEQEEPSMRAFKQRAVQSNRQLNVAGA